VGEVVRGFTASTNQTDNVVVNKSACRAILIAQVSTCSKSPPRVDRCIDFGIGTGVGRGEARLPKPAGLRAMRHRSVCWSLLWSVAWTEARPKWWASPGSLKGHGSARWPTIRGCGWPNGVGSADRP